MILAAFDTLLASLLLAVQQVYGERLVTLAIYGSVGRRTPRADSDIDMLLIVEGLPPNRSARQGAHRIWRGSSWIWDLKPDAVFGDRIEI